MKRRVRLVIVAGGVLVLAGAATPAGAQTVVPNAVEYLTKAKAVFERACGVCHGLERALSKSFDKAGWEKTVERMHDNGAEVDREERALVVAYLLTKCKFEAKCSACHGTDRPLGSGKSAAEWLATAERMAAKRPGHLTEAEVAEIAAYLSVVCPLP